MEQEIAHHNSYQCPTPCYQTCQIPCAQAGQAKQPAIAPSERGNSNTQPTKPEAKDSKTAEAPAPAPAPTKPKPKPKPKDEPKRLPAGRREAAGPAYTFGAASLEAQMADLQAAEERKLAAKAKRAARYRDKTPNVGSGIWRYGASSGYLP